MTPQEIRIKAIREVVAALMSAEALADRQRFLMDSGNTRTNEFWADWVLERFLKSDEAKSAKYESMRTEFDR